VESHLDRYLQLRDAQRSLNVAITKTLSRRTIEETAKKLGLWQKGGPAVRDEVELEFLNDSALYDTTINGVNAVARYAARKDLKLSPTEERLLRAMTAAHPTVLVVHDATEDLGVNVHDVLRDEGFFLTDQALARGASTNVSVVMRVLNVDGMFVSAGAGRAVDENVGRLLGAVGKLPDSAWSPKWRGAIGTNLYRLALSDEPGSRTVVTNMMAHGVDPLSLAIKATVLASAAVTGRRDP
jgi:hypothetical protein